MSALTKRKKGFTLIEMMVAVSIFSIIALIVSSVFITVAYSYQKARDLSRLADNINFAIEHMTYNLKLSKDYSCEGENISAYLFRTDDPVDITYSLNNEDDCLEFKKGDEAPYCLTEEGHIIVSNLFCQFVNEDEANGLKIRLLGSVVSSFGDNYDFALQTFVYMRF